MPMLMCLYGLIETSSFFARVLSEPSEQAFRGKDAMYRAWAASNHVVIEHHVCKPTVPVKRMSEMELDNRLLLQIG